MRKYKQPTLDVIRFETAEALTADVEVAMSGVYDFGEGVDEW